MKVIARSAATAAQYLATYAPDTRRYDELLDSRGAIRPHWRPLIDRLTAHDAREASRRQLALTRRLIAENGVTYNVYADPQGTERPWALDPVPLVLSAEEWRGISLGVAQRARLLNALLTDLYGPQRLIAEGLVPPELPFGHPNFLWPCAGLAPVGGSWLRLYAADLARAPDGSWWVLADRTQAPSGAGYALENRDIIEQVLPETLRDLNIERIRGFFGELREQLLSSPGESSGTLAVILTPGPYNETYFEHAYLARQLGLPLVEGSDLTVRGNTVYLKTLAGLKRVHTILRRLDDDYCDPLELRSSSALGVPGLTAAVRAGRVTVANALGTGVLESAAWLGFLPGIAERLLGERLLLPAVATWWCGERPALEYVMANLDRLVVKPSYPNQRFEPVFGRALSAPNRAELVERLTARPYAFVAQEHLALSQAPVLRTGSVPGFTAKSLTLRVYALLTVEGAVVMPGGLARIATDTAIDVVSSQRGGGSKDVWVLPSAAGAAPSVAARPAQPPVRHADMASRLVENLFWFGRYTVRCEDKARLLRGTLAARIDVRVWSFAVKFGRELGMLAPDGDVTTALRDADNPQGILADVRRLAWCASQARSRLSASYWRAVADLQQQLTDSIAAREHARTALDRLLLCLAALAGFALDDMTQDEGWRLLRVGRRLERLQFMSHLLARHLAGEDATQQAPIEWLLEACDSLRVYRPRYVVAPRLAPMLDLLIRDVQHPRALAFQRDAIARDLGALAHSLGAPAEERLDAPIPPLSDAELLVLEGDGEDAQRARRALVAQLQALGEAAAQLSDRLSMRHFSHTHLGAHAVAS
jgi:uncharacterized circularly permuted ATP-grasp superfamily protein/uncharacterized alpha-E superfamily protein